MKVLFIYPDFASTPDPHQRYGYYSEGLASISSCLKVEGHETDLYHILFPPEKDEFISKVRDFAPDLIAVAVRTSNFPYIRKFMGWCSEAVDVPLLAGGYHATIAPDETIACDGVDYVCLGEGEGATVDLANAVESGENTEKIANLWVKQKSGEIIKNAVRPMIEDLDQLPHPDYELFDYELLEYSLIKTVPAIVSRGCPYFCTFCCNHHFRSLYPNSKKYVRFRSPEVAIAYLKKGLIAYPKAQYISFFDDILPLKRKWFKEFVALYKKEIGLPFACNAFASGITDEIAKILSDAGCYRIHFGVESGNFDMRKDVLRRRMTNEQIIRGFDNCHKYGIATLAYNMVGLPFENRKKALDTIKLNARLRPNKVLAAIFYPFPHTEAHEMSVSAGFIGEKDVDYGSSVLLDQPDFSKIEIRFVSAFFRPFMRLYRLSFWLPKPLGRPLERSLDRVFLIKHMPYRPLTWIVHSFNRSMGWIKRLIKKRASFLYLFLRDRILKGNATRR